MRNAHAKTHTTQHPDQEWRGASQNPSPTAHTADPSQEWWGQTKTRTQAHIPKTPARSGRISEKPKEKHNHNTTVGIPVFVPCRGPGRTRYGGRG